MLAATKFWRDTFGGTFVEFTVMFPLFMMVTFGTVDAGYMYFDYARVSKAAYAGAHRAVVSDPVAAAVLSPTWDNTKLGNQCADIANGGSNVNCPSQSFDCTYSISNASASCGSSAVTAGAFDAIVNVIQQTYGCDLNNVSGCPIQRQNVRVSYATNELGFVGNPSGSSVNVTVGVHCVVHPFFFIGAIMQWTFSQNSADGCGSGAARGWTIPSYSTTLTSEDLSSG
jgi:Flp pilus assembly protein TadG